jgi:S1-C subfamily serine protease
MIHGRKQYHVFLFSLFYFSMHTFHKQAIAGLHLVAAVLMIVCSWYYSPVMCGQAWGNSSTRPPMSNANRDTLSDKRSKFTLYEKKLGTGSGLIISKAGLFITNCHVVSGAHRVTAYLHKQKIELEVEPEILDWNNDIAILRIKPNQNLGTYLPDKTYPIAMSDIQGAKMGQEVFTIGFPLTRQIGNNPRLTTGRVNSLFGRRDDPASLQINAQVHSGNSGGPLISATGELVGIITSTLSAEAVYESTGSLPQNVNYAVKSSYLSLLLPLLKDTPDIATTKKAKRSIEEHTEEILPYIVQVRTYVSTSDDEEEKRSVSVGNMIRRMQRDAYYCQDSLNSVVLMSKTGIMDANVSKAITEWFSAGREYTIHIDDDGTFAECSLSLSYYDSEANTWQIVDSVGNAERTKGRATLRFRAKESGYYLIKPYMQHPLSSSSTMGRYSLIIYTRRDE